MANIKSRKLDFFSSFTIILSALDNLEARRYLNLQAVMSDIPIVESGAAGYSGQVGVWEGRAECFDCRHHSPPTTFPVCTIRATPTQLIHCIVWAKEYLLGRVFGGEDIEDAGLNEIEDEGVAESLQREATAFKEITTCEDPDLMGGLLFEKVFCSDIENLLQMDGLWKDREHKPVPLRLENVKSNVNYNDLNIMNEWKRKEWTACFLQACAAFPSDPAQSTLTRMTLM